MFCKIALVFCWLGFAVSLPMKKVHLAKYSFCPDGWMRFKDSCYYIEMKKMDFAEAQLSCMERGATMFAADNVEEWLEVMAHTPLNYWSWAGLRYDNDAKQAKWKNSAGGVAVSELDWLNSPATAENNGMNTVARCVAHYNGDVGKSYSFYYHCGMDFYSICEKNATLLEVPADKGF
ncbi:hypothetical protein Aduo_006908 [Ancylostoma duodenale]